jgi:mRNA-degrading endonuclease RelE of RelBE toxin-antitoxin system
MRLILRPDFLKSAELLPSYIQSKLVHDMELLKKDVRHPLLHAKKLKGGFSRMFAFRLHRDWRVIFEYIDAETIRLLSVRHRKDAYR